MAGYIQLPRATLELLQDSPELLQAYITLRLQCRYAEPTEIFSAGTKITIGKGQLLTACATLAKQWNINKSNAFRRLQKLSDLGLIYTENLQKVGTMVTLLEIGTPRNDVRNDKATMCATMNATMRATIDTPSEPPSIEGESAIEEDTRATMCATMNATIEEQPAQRCAQPLLLSNKIIREENKEKGALKGSQKEKESARAKIDEIFAYFNSRMQGTPIAILSPDEWTKKRRLDVGKIYSKYGSAQMKLVIDKVAESNFLNGGGPRGWVAFFDWIFRLDNFTNIKKGNYDNREVNNRYHTKSAELNRSTAEYWQRERNRLLEQTEP